MTQIDLNSDLGESFGPWSMGDDAAMLGIVTSANVACGGHASDPDTMAKTLALAVERSVVVGAHPGYLDREGFGRRVIPMSTQEIAHMVAAQFGTLDSLATLSNTSVRYLKPHGALGNLAADDVSVAQAIASTLKIIAPDVAILAISGTALEHEARQAGVKVYSEIFADRAYTPTGRLVPRSQPGAVIHDAQEAAERLLRFLDSGLMPTVDGKPIALNVHSVCVHGDTPGAVEMATLIRRKLETAGVSIEPFLS